MHWLALVLSDLPDSEPSRDFASEEAPRRMHSVPNAWRTVPPIDLPSRSTLSSRSTPVLSAPGSALS